MNQVKISNMSIDHIKYKMHIDIDVEGYVAQMRSHLFQKAKPKDDASRDYWDKFVRYFVRKTVECIERVNEKQYYSFSMKPTSPELVLIRDVHKEGEDEVIKIDLDKRMKRTYFTDEKGTKVVMEEWLDLKGEEVVEYTLERNEEQRKEILGYDCYKIFLSQKVIANGKEEEYKFEMYVTDQLPFPAHILLELAAPIVTACPLEVSYFDTWADKLVTRFTAVHIGKIVDRQVFLDLNQNWEINEAFLELRRAKTKRISAECG